MRPTPDVFGNPRDPERGRGGGVLSEPAAVRNPGAPERKKLRPPSSTTLPADLILRPGNTKEKLKILLLEAVAMY